MVKLRIINLVWAFTNETQEILGHTFSVKSQKINNSHFIIYILIQVVGIYIKIVFLLNHNYLFI